MVNHYLDELVLNADKILLLQGPIGDFFTELSKWLISQNKTVYKFNFNGGDEYFYPNSIENTIAYRDALTQFESYLILFCLENKIDTFVCFGDHRRYHRIAKRVAKEYGIAFYVFEEGYFRPEYITLEKEGVNAFSPLPRNAAFFLEKDDSLCEPVPPQKVARGFLPMAKRAILYYSQGYFKRKEYPKYLHHRITQIKYYLKLWIISGFKRACYHFEDRNFAKEVKKGKFDDFFVVPLQVYDDSQVKVHSPNHENVQEFLEEVLVSFANHAPEHLNLIVKHHPMDRGFIDYQTVIDKYIKQYPEIKNRIFYIHDVPMPALLRKGKGMITLNSTSGISALLHHMPVITLGKANYDIAGLTFQGSLDEFWHNEEEPNSQLFDAYRRYHLNKTHINGSFYNKVILRSPYNQ